jgi:uncharacterized membrane protein YkvA (DUF1232 family)
MSISLNFELNDRDLEHFHEAVIRSQKAAEGKTPAEIIDCSVKLLADAQKVHIPDFILQRLLRLDDMIAMVRDEAWAMSEEDKDRVLAALVYFCDPDDVIPDSVQVLGFLDDAIMIELSVRELKHELDAYDDFCDFREHQAERRGLTADRSWSSACTSAANATWAWAMAAAAAMHPRAAPIRAPGDRGCSPSAECACGRCALAAFPVS